MSINAVPISIFHHFPSGATGNVVQQDFRRLGQDLKTGDLAAAQNDLSRIESDLKSGAAASSRGMHDYHVLRIGLEDFGSQSTLTQPLKQLRQAVTSGNLEAAQQAYAALSNQR